MVEFDSGQHMAMIQLSVDGVSVNVNLNLDDFSSSPILAKSRLDRLNPSQLKGLLEYTDFHFRFVPGAGDSVQEQFFKSLSCNCNNFIYARNTLDPEQMKEIGDYVASTNALLLETAEVPKGLEEYVLSAEYNGGVDHFTKDSDFISIRAGGRVVAIIALPGNDYNEVKQFLKEGGQRCMSSGNIDALRRIVKRMKSGQLYSLLKSRPSTGRGLSIVDTANK